MNILGRISAINTLAVCYIYSAEVILYGWNNTSFHLYFWPTTYFLNVKVFPTVVRNIGLGSSSFWARVRFLLSTSSPLNPCSFDQISKFCPGGSDDCTFHSRPQGLWRAGKPQVRPFDVLERFASIQFHFQFSWFCWSLFPKLALLCLFWFDQHYLAQCKIVLSQLPWTLST